MIKLLVDKALDVFWIRILFKIIIFLCEIVAFCIREYKVRFEYLA